MTQLGDKPDLLRSVAHTLAVLEKFRLDIQKALCYDSSNTTFDDVVLGVLKGELDVYELPNSVIIAHDRSTRKFPTYHLFLCAGELDELLAQEDMMIREAKLRGAKRLTLAGRRGWEKPLKKMGWEHVSSTFKKDV